MSDELIAGPMRLELHPHPEGPLVDTDDEAFDSLCGILWCAVHGQPNTELYDAIMSGDEWCHEIMQLRPVLPKDDLDQARAAWRRFTGAELEGELRAMYRGGDATSIVPLEILREAARAYRAVVEERRCEPPWLFVPEPRWSTAHDSEHARLVALDARLESEPEQCEDELAALGLASGGGASVKLEHLLRWQLNRVAAIYIDRMRGWGCLELPEPPWLFAVPVRHNRPHPDERAALAELEAEASAIDAAERALGGDSEPDALVERRAALLRRLATHGLLDADHRDDKLHIVHRNDCTTLVEWYEATLETLSYLASAARQRYNPDAGAQPILGAPVCIDACRSLAPPGEVTRFAWLSWGEYLLREHGPGPDVTAGSGQFPYHDQDGLIWVFWRKDAGVPALRHVVLDPGSRSSGG